jgi:microcystin-dependent protein
MVFGVRFRELLAQTPGVAEEFDLLYAQLAAFLLASHNADGTLISPAPAQISELGLAVGTIVPYGGASIPTGWLLCDGTAYSRGLYRTLYDAIGTSFGTGDGATTFNVPDLRGRFPLGQAASGTGSTLGSTGGAIDHTHTGPSHTHTFTTGAPSATTDATAGGVAVASGTHTHTGTTDASGAGNTGTANPPYQVVRYIILSV